MAAVVIGLGAFFLGLALMINAIALLVPYWVILSSRTYGLWGDCTCNWHFDNFEDYWNNQPDWYKATEALYAIGLGLIVVAVLLSMLLACCCTERKGAKCMLTIGILLLMAFACVACAIIVFGVMENKDRGTELVDSTRLFGWGLWLGVVGAILALVTGILYVCSVRTTTVRN